MFIVYSACDVLPGMVLLWGNAVGRGPILWAALLVSAGLMLAVLWW